MSSLPQKRQAKVTRLPLPEPVPVPKIRKKKPLLLLFAFLILYFLVLFSVQFVRYFQMTHEVKVLSREIAAIEEENASLMNEIERLDNPEYLEELARERLGMMRRGELLFYIQESSKEPINY